MPSPPCDTFLRDPRKTRRDLDKHLSKLRSGRRENEARRRRDRHFWHHMRYLALLFQKFEVIEHGMVVWEIELADHPHGIVPGLNACKLDSPVGVKQFATRQPREKIEVPPRAPELTIGREL